MTDWLLDDELVQDSYGLLTEEALKKCEGDLGIQLPKDYRSFLLWKNGGYCPDETLANGKEVLVFYSISHESDCHDLRSVRMGWSNLFPEDFLAIASNSFGDCFCIHLENQKIYFLEHDNPFQDFPLLPAEADSLKEWLHSFCREIPDYEPLQDIQEFIAVREGRQNELKSLLKKGLNVNMTNEQGDFLLHYAIRLRRSGIVSELLAAGADVEASGADGHTALFRAGSAQTVDIGCLLIDAGANMNAIDSQGSSVLIHAINCGNCGLALKLIAYGANIDYRDATGQRAIDYCTDIYSRQYVLPALLAAKKSS